MRGNTNEIYLIFAVEVLLWIEVTKTNDINLIESSEDLGLFLEDLGELLGGAGLGTVEDVGLVWESDGDFKIFEGEES